MKNYELLWKYRNKGKQELAQWNGLRMHIMSSVLIQPTISVFIHAFGMLWKHLSQNRCGLCFCSNFYMEEWPIEVHIICLSMVMNPSNLKVIEFCGHQRKAYWVTPDLCNIIHPLFPLVIILEQGKTSVWSEAIGIFKRYAGTGIFLNGILSVSTR